MRPCRGPAPHDTTQGKPPANLPPLGHTGHANAAGDGQAAASGAADQTTDQRGAPGSGARVEAGTNTASEPTGRPPGTAPPWGQGHLNYARLEGDASRPSDKAEQAAAQDLGLWIPRLTAGGQLAPAVRIRWLLTLQSRHLVEGTRTMADITFGHRTGHTPLATMNHPGQWHYVATRLMVHMGAYNPDAMNGLHWQWHQHAALRIRATMQEHNIWDIPGSPGYQGHASGHRQQRSQDVLEPPRQAEWVPPLACTEAPYDRLPRGGAQAVLTPQGCRAARRNSARRQRTVAAPAAAAARHLPRHGESSFMRVCRETMGAPTTPTPNRHHLPPIPDAGPRGSAPNGRTSPPFSRQSSASDRQRCTRAPTGRQTEHPAHPPPPSQGRRPAR